jgi:putative endonuclease
MWHLYLLECNDGSIYTGVTTDPARRLAQHNSGKGAKYTRSRGPCKMVACWAVGDRSRALRLEIRVKRLRRVEKLALVPLASIDILEPQG